MKIIQLLISLITLGLCLGRAQTGTTVVWTGGAGDGKWCNRTNWNTLQVPSPGDDVYITQDGTYTVMVDCIISPTIAHLTLGGSSGTQTLVCEAGLAMPIEIRPTAVLSVSAANGLAGPITNWGTLLLPSSGGLSSPWIENRFGALVDCRSNATIGYGVFNNAGTFRKSSGTNACIVLGQQVVFNNTGLVDVQSGTLEFDNLGALSSSGTISVASGAVLMLTSGTYDFAPGNLFTGDGIISLTDGALVRGILNGTPHFRVDYFAAFDAQLQAGSMVWNYGSGTMSGTLTIGPNALFNLGSTFTFRGTLTNWGTIIWPSGGGTGWRWEAAARLENQPGAVFDLQCDGSLSAASGSNWVFRNVGTFLKSGGTNTASLDQNIAFTNTGLVDIQSGTLRLRNLVNNGTINVAGIARLELAGGNFVFDPAQSLTGTGTVWLSGYAGMPMVNGTLKDTPCLAMSASSTFNGWLETTMWWTNGSLYGALTVGTDGLLNLVTGSKNLYGSMTNWGRINWLNSGWTWNWYDGARLENQPGALVDLQGDGSFSSASGAQTFNNFGTLRKSGGGNTTSFGSGYSFVNQGEVDALSGTLSFASPFAQTGGLTSLAGGAITPTAGFNLTGGRLSGSGTINGSLTNSGGVVSPGGPIGVLALTGNYSQGNGGALNVEVGGRNVGQFDQVSVAGGAKLDGALTVTLANSFSPALHDRFQIFSCASRNGTFSATGLPAGVSINYSNNGVFLVVTGAVPVQIIGPSLSGRNFAFSFATVSNQSYTIQYKDDLAKTNWIYFTNFAGNGSLMQVVAPLTNGPRRFFRARQP